MSTKLKLHPEAAKTGRFGEIFGLDDVTTLAVRFTVIALHAIGLINLPSPEDTDEGEVSKYHKGTEIAFLNEKYGDNPEMIALALWTMGYEIGATEVTALFPTNEKLVYDAVLDRMREIRENWSYNDIEELTEIVRTEFFHEAPTPFATSRMTKKEAVAG